MLLKNLQQQVAKVRKDLGVLSGSVKTVYDNQKALAESEERLDEQFAVLSRMCVMKVNQLVTALSLAMNQDLVDPITYEGQNEMFLEWHRLRLRDDWRKFTREWFTGADMSEILPPMPEPKEEETAQDTPGEEDPESARTFGGDYAEDSDNEGSPKGEPEGTEASSPDAVSKVQDHDEGESGPDDTTVSADVP